MYQTEKNVENFGLECRVQINFMDEFWLIDVLFFTPDMTLYGKQVSSASNHFQFQIPNKNNWIVYNMLSLMNKTHDMLSYKNKFSFLLTNIIILF